MNNSLLRAELQYHEGVKLQVYRDSLGFLTAGIGHLLTKADGDLKEHQYVNSRQVDEWFDSDVNTAVKIAKTFCEGCFDTLTEERQRIIVNMCFNLGPKIEQFKTLKAALLLGRWDLAANAMQNSTWYSQVGRRGPQLVEAMKTGIISFP